MDLVAAWRGIGGSGNCFFASVQMMQNLIRAGVADAYTIVTGRFEPPDLQAPITHCWLEKNGIVLNVSNLRTRPLYVMPRRAYYQTNFLTDRGQRTGPARVRRMVRTCGGDIGEATRRLLQPTFQRWK